MLKQSLLKLLSVVLLSFAQCAGMMSLGWELSPTNKQASTVPNLIPLLKDPDSRIRYIAADALGEIGDAAKSTIPQLIPLLKDPDRTVVNRTRSALKKLGYKQ